MRMLHTMLRVTDMDASVKFYSEVMGMKLLMRQEFPAGRFTLAFLGYEKMDKEAAIELTQNWDVDKYDLGDGYGHIAIEVEDVTEACNGFRDRGAKVTREPGPMNAGDTELAFIEDPDGYKIELLNKAFAKMF